MTNKTTVNICGSICLFMKGGSFFNTTKIKIGGIYMKDLREKNEFEFYEKIKNWSFDEFDIETEYLTDWDMYEVLKRMFQKNKI